MILFFFSSRNASTICYDRSTFSGMASFFLSCKPYRVWEDVLSLDLDPLVHHDFLNNHSRVSPVWRLRGAAMFLVCSPPSTDLSVWWEWELLFHLPYHELKWSQRGTFCMLIIRSIFWVVSQWGFPFHRFPHVLPTLFSLFWTVVSLSGRRRLCLMARISRWYYRCTSRVFSLSLPWYFLRCHSISVFTNNSAVVFPPLCLCAYQVTPSLVSLQSSWFLKVD